MTTRRQLSFSSGELSVWATNSGRTLHPDSSEVTKEDGWITGTRCPARVLNWLQKNFCDWISNIISMKFSTWQMAGEGVFPDPPNDVFLRVAYLPSQAEWAAVSYDDDPDYGLYYRSVDGVVWRPWGYAVGPLSYPMGCVSVQSSRVIFGTVNGLEHSTIGGTPTEVTNATIGGGFADGVVTVDTKRPDSNYTIVVDYAGIMRIAATGVAGSWSSPTTAPSAHTTQVKKVIYSGVDDTWFYFAQVGTTMYLYVSYDDGDTWSSISVPSLDSQISGCIAYDPVSGRLVLSSGIVNDIAIAYSDDYGDTWTVASVTWESDMDTFMEATLLSDVYSCGSGIWIGAGRRVYGRGFVFVSVDNAQTWRHVASLADTYGSASQIMSDGRRILLAGDTWIWASSGMGI